MDSQILIKQEINIKAKILQFTFLQAAFLPLFHIKMGGA